jgi:hypothetical protein
MLTVATKTYNFRNAGFSVLADGRLIFPLLIIRDGDERRLRIKNLENHISGGDYFGTLATIIDLVAQQLPDADPPLRATLANLEKDLLYLQKKYKIIEK